MDFSSVDVLGQDSFIVRFRTRAQSVFSVVPEEEWWGILVPLYWSGDYFLNGWEATPTTVFQLDGSHEYHVIAERRDALTVGVRRSVLESVLASLLGQECYRLPHGHHAFEIPDGHKKRLTTILFDVIAAAAPGRSTDDFCRMSRVIENDLISMIANWIIEKDDIQPRESWIRRSDLDISRDVLEVLAQNEHATMSMAELCQVVGVGKSRLHQAFTAVYGVSPGQYLYRRRLTFAHDALLRKDISCSSVKEVALECGFNDSGRFARVYSLIFGEFPKETLKSAAGL